MPEILKTTGATSPAEHVCTPYCETLPDSGMNKEQARALTLDRSTNETFYEGRDRKTLLSRLAGDLRTRQSSGEPR